MKRWVIIAMYLLGLSIVCYPMLAKVYYNYNMDKTASGLNEKFHVDSDDQKTRYYGQQQYNHSIAVNHQQIAEPEVKANPNEKEMKLKTSEDIIATIRIPKLKLHYPVYNEATPENLNRGVSRVSGTSYPVGGRSTNSVLAAHSYSPFHEWFTHTDRLKNGDRIIINNFKETLYYKVYDREIVTPDQVEALRIRKGKDIITLLTCTPSGEKRLLVYAERTTKSGHSMKASADKEIEQSFVDRLKILSESWLIIIIVIVMTFIFILMLRRDVNREQRK